MISQPLTIWDGIDPAEAEARLRNLRRRESELEGAFDSQRQMQKLYPDSFAVSLSLKSLEARKEKIAEELTSVLHHRVNEPIQISLNGRAFHDHSAGLSTLGVFLLRLQKLYSAVAQAVQTGPTLRGPIASTIRDATELRLANVFNSSFGMTLYVPSRLDLTGRSVSADSLKTMFDLFANSNDEKKLMEASGALGGRVTNHLRHLTSTLASSDSGMIVSWSDYMGLEHKWNASQDISRTIVGNLKNIIQTRSAEKRFTGFLVGGSMFRNRFELLVQESGLLVEGSTVVGLAPDMKKYFGTRCTVTVDETEVVDRGSGESKTYYVLTSIQDGEQNLEKALALPSA